MAQAADYFLAAMDRYEDARNKRQEMAMQKEQHALYMQNGLMKLDQMRGQVAAGEEFQSILQNPAIRSPTTAQNPAPQPGTETPAPAAATPSFDSSALQKTLNQMSGYMNEFNGARGNSGFGTTLSLHPQQDGRMLVGAANPEQGGALPLTVNPQDNNSAPLYLSPEDVGAFQTYVQGNIDSAQGDPAKLKAFAQDQFGIRHDEQGRLYVPQPDLTALPEQQTAATTPAPAQAPAPAPQPAPATTGTKTKTSGSVSTQPRFNKATVHDPVKFQEAAADPNLRPNERDREVLKKIDEDHTYAAGIPLHMRSRVAALGLKAGYFNGDQALNMAQTGFSNMNSVELENAMTALKMNKVQFRKAELDFTNALRYDARIKQAQLDNYGMQMQASQARITASTEAAATQRQIRDNNLLGQKRGQVDAFMKATGEAFDRYVADNNIDAAEAKRLKAAVQPALTSAVYSQDPAQIPALLADGRLPQRLQELVADVVTKQYAAPADKKPAAKDSAAEVLAGKGPSAATTAQVKEALPKNQDAAIKENASTYDHINKMALGEATNLRLPDEDSKKAFAHKAAVSLMKIMPMIALRGADLQGKNSSNYGFVSNVVGSYGRLKQSEETQRYGDENLMLVAVTNKLSEVPADVEAQQTREVMLRLQVLGHGNNFYHKMVTGLLEKGTPNQDVFRTSIGLLDEEITKRGDIAKLHALQNPQAQPGAPITGMPWDPAR